MIPSIVAGPPQPGDLVIMVNPNGFRTSLEGWQSLTPEIVWRYSDGSEFLRSLPFGVWTTIRGAMGSPEIAPEPSSEFLVITTDEPTKTDSTWIVPSWPPPTSTETGNIQTIPDEEEM